jgi:hypothetical protein
MSEITKIKIFDLDETIIRAPGYTGKKVAENENLQFGDAYSFYDHSKSLSDDLYNIQVISPVMDSWKSGKKDDSCLNVLITHRVEELKETVISLLKSRGITMDESFFLGRKSKKVDTTLDLINKYYAVQSIEVYEDSIQQIYLYQEFFKEVNQVRQANGIVPIDVKIWIVDKSRVYEIRSVALSNEKNITLI